MGGPGLAWNTEVNLWGLQHNSAEEGGRLMSAVAVVCKRMAAVDEWAWRPSLKIKSPIKKLSWKPHMVLGAILAAGVPIAKDTHETNASRPVTRQVNDSANNAVATHSFGALQSWFESSANPFLTTAQAKDRLDFVRPPTERLEALLAIQARAALLEAERRAAQARAAGTSSAGA